VNLSFLLDVFLCSLNSFGGPEAHYGIFSNILVKKKQYISEETLAELIGVFSLVPGPSSTQTITAIGYLMGGPLLALLTFFVWAFPAMVMMTLIGIFFTNLHQQPIFTQLLTVLPSIAIGFIAFAGWSLSRRVIKKTEDFFLFVIVFILGYLLIPISVWTVPLLLVATGFFRNILLAQPIKRLTTPITIPWIWLILVVAIAILNEGLLIFITNPWLSLLTSFYRYGYSVIGGGQIVIPLMIQDLVTQQSLISLETFLSGYAIDQAIPGPLFSFASFVGAQVIQPASLSWLGGILSGFSIFLPGILLVYFVVPIWQDVRKNQWMKGLLSGITVAAASLIVLTAMNQLFLLEPSLLGYGLTVSTFFLLTIKKIPAPLIVVLLLAIGLLF
jgi:chromate transporter